MEDEKTKPVKKPKSAGEEMVTFTPDQIKLIDKMFEDRLKGVQESMKRPDNVNSPVSMYNVRDPKSIESVKVSRFDGKWVLGFKNLQNDPYKKKPLYLRYGVEPIRKLYHEPYVTLQLSSDGKKSETQNVEIDVCGKKFWVEEKEVLLLTYMENRNAENIPVVKCNVKTVIHDHGVLGRVSAYAVAVDSKGNPESRPTILAQSKTEERSFVVELAGFEEPVEYITDFLG